MKSFASNDHRVDFVDFTIHSNFANRLKSNDDSSQIIFVNRTRIDTEYEFIFQSNQHATNTNQMNKIEIFVRSKQLRRIMIHVRFDES